MNLTAENILIWAFAVLRNVFLQLKQNIRKIPVSGRLRSNLSCLLGALSQQKPGHICCPVVCFIPDIAASAA